MVRTGDFCLEGTWGAEISNEVAPLPARLVVTKHRSSAFRGTDLDLLLRSRGIETVVVIGEQTPGCVEATFRDAAYHDYYNVLVEDCVAAFDRGAARGLAARPAPPARRLHGRGGARHLVREPGPHTAAPASVVGRT